MSVERILIVLLDIGLPGVGGYQVARELRADPALDHLTKPVGDAVLNALMDSAGE
jgi:CheY-like chemotaxis protein